MRERNCFGGNLTIGKNTFNVCDLETYIKHAILLH